MNEFFQFLVLLWKIVKFILDITSWTICIILALIGCVLPWRAVTFYKLVQDTDENDKREYYLGHFFRTVFEIFCLCFLIPSLVIPSRAAGFLTIFRKKKFCDSFVDNVFPEYACLWFASPFIGIVEVVAYIFGLIALLSVVRTYQTICDAVKEARDKSNWTVNAWNGELMFALFSNGVTVLLDIFFLPMLAALGLTIWRLPPVLKELRRGFTWVTRVVIFKQFLWLLVDLVLVIPSWVLVTLTVYRLPTLLKRIQVGPSLVSEAERELAEHLSQEARISKRVDAECGSMFKFSKLQKRPIRAAGLVFLDIICFPMIFMLLITGHRFRPITTGLAGLDFHKTVVKQFRELLIDLPFLFAGFFLLLTIYRADLALKLFKPDAGSAWERRREAGKQFLRLVGDVASLVPFLVVVCTLYRFFPLFLSLKARMSRLLYEDPEMRLQEWEFNIPQPKGKPRLLIRAQKHANLCDILTMQLQVAGAGFWAAVAKAKGGVVAAAGQAMLPYVLKNGREVDLQRFQHGQSEVEFAIEFDINVKQSSALKFLQLLPEDAELLLQLEGTIRGADGGRKAVLLAVPCVIRDLVRATASESFLFQATAAEEDDAAAAEQRAALRGTPGLRRDAWLPIILAEFAQVFIDVVHLCIAVVLLAVPWRFVCVVRCFLEPPALRCAKKAFRVVIALEGWDRVCNGIMAKVERLANRYSKAAAEDACTPTCKSGSNYQQHRGRDDHDIERGIEDCVGCLCCVFCPCCPNYNDWDNEDWEIVRGHGDWRHIRRNGRVAEEFDKQLRHLCAPLIFYRAQLRLARKKWPEEAEWAALADDVDVHIQRQSEAFFWLLLLHETHILFTSGAITAEEHERVAAAIRLRALPLKQDGPREFEELRQRFKSQLEEAAAGRRRCKGKSKTFLFTVLREQLLRACTDFLSLPIVLLLLITLYRIPHIKTELGKNPDMPHFKSVLKRQAGLLLCDIWRLLQFLLLFSLLLVTFVKLPDFLSAFRPAQGLRKARDCALAAVTELVVGIGELLLMLTAWKTYRLLVSAVIFGLLSPAAMLAMALPGSSASTRVRFAFTSLCWLGLVVVSYWASSIQISLIAASFMLLAFFGFCVKQISGWMKPRGGGDWWSAVVRCTFPNALSLISIVVDAAVLAWLAREEKGFFAADTVGGDYAAYVGLGVVGVAILLETLPMVSEEMEQQSIVLDSAWRIATMITKEVLLLPIILALAPYAIEYWFYRIPILFLMPVALLSATVWDVDVPYALLLDIRSVGLSAGGRKLLMIIAVLAGVDGHAQVFLALTVALAAWIAVWIPCGCSATWTEVLRLGVPAGAVAAAVSEPFAMWIAWGAAVALALTNALASVWRRRCLLASSDVPQAVQHLSGIQYNLQLWDKSPPPMLQPSADVRSTAQLVLQLEDGIPIERLNPSFFTERRLWRTCLADAPDYGAVLEHIERLSAMVSVPVTRVLVKQVLARLHIPKTRMLQGPLANEIVKYAVPPIDFKIPAPPKGWEFGKLDLAELREHASRTARSIPALIQTKAPRPSTIGSTLFDDLMAQGLTDPAITDPRDGTWRDATHV